MSQGQWGADPSRRHEWRWWDGARWTEYVRDGDQAGVDALDPLATTPISTPRAAAGSLVLEPSGATSVRKRWPVKTHVILSVLTCGLWLLALPAVLLWQRGSRRAGAIAGAAAATLVIAAGATNGGTGTVDAGGTGTETRATSAAAGSSTVSAARTTIAPSEASKRPSPTATQSVTAARSAVTATAAVPSVAVPTGAPPTFAPPKPSSTKAAATKAAATKPAATKPVATKPVATAPSPKPTPVKTTVATIQGVHPGAFCSQHGALGVTSTGKLMRCTTSPTEARYRWRAA